MLAATLCISQQIQRRFSKVRHISIFLPNSFKFILTFYSTYRCYYAVLSESLWSGFGFNRIVTTSGVPAPTIAMTLVVRVDGDCSGEDSSSSSASGAEGNANSLRSIYVMSVWETDDEDKCVSIAILMPR
eukprot:IDg10242t1